MTRPQLSTGQGCHATDRAYNEVWICAVDKVMLGGSYYEFPSVFRERAQAINAILPPSVDVQLCVEPNSFGKPVGPGI